MFVYDALVATRRDDLELDTVEGMWLEIAVPKSRSFMVKLNGILDTASSEGKEMLLFGDFSRCFMSEMTPVVNNSNRFSGV